MFEARNCGKTDVVIDTIGASKQIQTLYSGKSNTKIEDEKKMEIVRIAGQFIAVEIRCMDYDSEALIANLDDLDTETHLAFLPPCLRLLNKSLQSKRSRSDNNLKHAMLGQTIVKITKKTHTPPILTAFGVTISHLSDCGQQMHHAEKLGISASYRAIGNFEDKKFCIGL